VALVCWLTGGYQIVFVQVAQCILSAMACVVIYGIFRRALPNETAAWLAGLACALYPMQVWYTPRLWTETFLTLVVALFSLALVYLLQKPGAGAALLCGLLAGVAALSKGIALVFFPLALLILVIYFRKTSLRWAVLFSGAALLLILPWTWRNWQITGYFLPIHTDSGVNFYLGNGFTRHWLEAPFSYADLKTLTVADMEALPAPASAQPADAVLWDRMLLSAALDQIKADPWLLLKKLFVQSLTFWYLAADFKKSLLTGVLQIPILILALPGLLRATRERSWALSLLIPIAGIMGVSVLVFAFARLSATIIPYLIGLAVYGLRPERLLKT
jgi:4-amino-4-deoxy-L-arabinose transferase-like glycosyltransferase